jgi:hypothetical protein
MCNVLLPTGINPIAVNKYINKDVGSWNVAVVFIDSLFVRFDFVSSSNRPLQPTDQKVEKSEDIYEVRSIIVLNSLLVHTRTVLSSSLSLRT